MIPESVTGVRVVDANTQEAKVYRSRVVFLCASTLASTQILLNSRSPGSERSFADSSGMLGHYVMDHSFRTSFLGTVPDAELSPLYRLWPPPQRRLYSALPQSCRPGCRRRLCARLWHTGRSRPRPAAPRGFGKAMKEGCGKYSPWTIHFTAFAECLPIRTTP